MTSEKVEHLLTILKEMVESRDITTMHNILRILTPQQKRKWPEHLPELVFAYNFTVHSSTGYSPYFLMCGRDPILPVDHLVITTESEATITIVDEYLPKHKKRLTEAMEPAKQNLDKVAEQRREQYNRSKIEVPRDVRNSKGP